MASPLTPAAGQRPVAADRNYSFPWTNQWNTVQVQPDQPRPPATRNDIDAAVTNLFVGHNRFHDCAYRLGFTEENYNAQHDNFGNGGAGRTTPRSATSRPARVTGGAPTFEGRDNANQITLQDGVPPITNQYLFQPIAGAFYAPCTDGDFDMSVFGHEYTHLISNRMVGGPDSGLTGAAGRRDGRELVRPGRAGVPARVRLHAANGANAWAVGPYVTGNKQRGIRNYALNANPLNYSDIGYDIAGRRSTPTARSGMPSTTTSARRSSTKYNAAFPASNTALQLRCADGELPADQCPGNRRWIQLMYDALADASRRSTACWTPATLCWPPT